MKKIARHNSVNNTSDPLAIERAYARWLKLSGTTNGKRAICRLGHAILSAYVDNRR